MVAAVVLAAGGGQRSGGPKALLLADGVTLVGRAVAVARDAGCDPVVAVLGCEADRVRKEADLAGATVVDNESWRTGAGSSLRVALEALAGTGAEAAVVLTVEQVGVGAALVGRLVDGVGPGTLRTATYHGRRAHPVVLGREHWAGVTALAVGDLGARAYLTAHSAQVELVACEDLADGKEIELAARPAG
jgi:nicotine blue oxidoreductase